MENKLPFIASLCTALFGITAIVKPRLIATIVGLIPQGKTGTSEIRAVYGGWILGLAGFAIWNQSIEVYYCLGTGWLGAAFIRLTSFGIDKSYTPKNLRMLMYELFFAILFLVKF